MKGRYLEMGDWEDIILEAENSKHVEEESKKKKNGYILEVH